jgi:hypothetical protein|tara:strand:- start:528 stop:677 length:150 start_codon:yes stop_codon:yes gene_type:complete
MDQQQTQNVSKDEGIFKNPESLDALKKISQSPKDLNNQLMNQFRAIDQN